MRQSGVGPTAIGAQLGMKQSAAAQIIAKAKARGVVFPAIRQRTGITTTAQPRADHLVRAAQVVKRDPRSQVDPKWIERSLAEPTTTRCARCEFVATGTGHEALAAFRAHSCALAA